MLSGGPSDAQQPRCDDTDVSGCRGCGDQGLGEDGKCVLAMAAKNGDQNIADSVVPAD